MEEIAAIVERIIAEHKVILADLTSFEKVSNDATAYRAIESGKEAFMPGRLASREGLKRLDDARARVDTGLHNHFHWEETTLLDAFTRYRADSLIPTLKTLMSEHDGIRDRLGELKGLVEELSTEKLSRHLWEAKAYDMRAHMTNLQKTVQTHAASEQVLFNELLKQLKNN